MVQTVQKSLEIPQLQHCNEVIDVHVVSVVQVPRVWVVKKTVEDRHSLRSFRKTFENPETVPQMQVLEKTTEIPQFRVADKVVDVPCSVGRASSTGAGHGEDNSDLTVAVH